MQTVQMVFPNPVFFLDHRHTVPDMRCDRMVARLFEGATRFLQQRINSQGVHFRLRLGISRQEHP